MENLNYPWVSSVLERLPRAATALPRALLLSGRPGLGKRATAFFLAQGLLCETQRDQLQACGTCVSCLLFRAGNHPDLRTLDIGQEEEGASAGAADEEGVPSKKAPRHISVERVRALTDFVTITAHRGGAKVICIMPAEAMLPAAANAVLKILEEPPGETYFLLVSHQPARLVATIRSRCFNLDFASPDIRPALDWLRKQGVAQAELALAQGCYAPLAAVDRAADENFWSQRKLLLDALAAVGFDPLSAAQRAEDIDGELISNLLGQWAYDIAALQSGGGVRYHLDYATSLRTAAAGVPTHDLMKWYDAVIQYGRVAQRPLNKRLAMESLLAAYPGRESSAMAPPRRNGKA